MENNLDEKLTRAVEKLIVLEQKLISVEEKLLESKSDRQKIHESINQIQEVNLKTKTFIGAVVFVVGSIFSIIVTFKDQVLNLFGIK